MSITFSQNHQTDIEEDLLFQLLHLHLHQHRDSRLDNYLLNDIYSRAGKSTTIRMLLALQRPTRGRAALLAFDAAADSVKVHRRTGYLPGDLELFPRLTGRQHIAWFARAPRRRG